MTAVENLPALVDRASRTLADARTSAEVLDARDAATFAYDAAKAAGRFARAKRAHDDVLSRVYRAQADALLIEARAKMRLADEYDLAQARGEVAGHGGGRNFKVADRNVETTIAELGLRRDEIHDARKLRDAEREDPGIIERAIAARLMAAQEPTRATIKKTVAERQSEKRPANRVGLSPSQETCTVSDLAALVASGRKYGCIYADPPWVYDNQGTRAATGNHYEGLSVEQLCALPVRELAADDAHLHLWTTNAFLFECPRIFEAWGFEFRSSFVWVKPQMGIGNYWRNSHEILLTAIRGNAKRFNDHSIKSWGEFDRGKHSAKPEQIRHYIERASEGPYLEMFGRSAAQGWSVWGNEVERGLLFHDVGQVA